MTKSTINEKLSTLGLLSQREDRANMVGVILTDYSLAEILGVINANSDGWNGDIGRGARILSKILFQL